MRAIVTGGAGFIGSALVRNLLQDGFEVMCLDSLSYSGRLENLQECGGKAGFQFEQVDIRDRRDVDDRMAAFGPDVVFHLAAESHVDRSIDGPGVFVETNVNGTFNLLESFRKHWLNHSHARFVHISTDEVFGSLGPTGKFDESSPYRPNSPYSASKAASDHLVRAWYATYGIPCLISNCSNNYGPRQFPEKLIPLTIVNALERKPIRIYGRGTQIRDWLFVEDHVSALRAIADRGRPGDTYAVGGNSERTNLDVVGTVIDALAAETGSDPEELRALVTHVPDRPGHDVRYAIDATKMERELGWIPETEFASGIRMTVRWYLDNQAWIGGAMATYDGGRLGVMGDSE